MRLDLSGYIATLDPRVMFQLANAVPDGEMIWATLLPEDTRDTYRIDDSQMVVYSTMAGLTGRDSPYAPGGVVVASDFKEDIVKWSIEAALGENQLIKLQELATKVSIGSASPSQMIETLLNFSNKIIAQSLRDGMEYIRGRAIQDGALDWTFNGKQLVVDYAYPAGNKLTRTGDAGGDWGGPNTTFWADIELARRLLDRQVRVIMMTTNTLNRIIANDANKVQVVETGRSRYSSSYTLKRVAQASYANTVPEDYRSQVDIVTYDRNFTLFDPTSADAMKHVPAMDDDKVIFFGQPTGIRFEVGSTELPEYAYGYTHIGPTVEGGGGAGRWMRLYTPENQPWRLVGQGVMNGLPVIREPRRIVTFTLAAEVPVEEEEGEGEGEGEGE
jgi:hypothetical protein